MKTRTTKTEKSTDVEVEEVSAPSTTGFEAGLSPELWIFDGIDEGTAPYEIDLPHPRTGQLSTYALGVKSGKPVLGEIRVFKSEAPSSFLTVLENTENKTEHRDGATQDEPPVAQQTALIGGGAIRFVTEIDPVFMLLPVLAPSQASAGRNATPAGMFRQFDDFMEMWEEKSRHVSRIANAGYKFQSGPDLATSMSDPLQAAMERCCDSVMAGGEKMYRFSEDKFFGIVLSKAKGMVARGLPPSLERLAARVAAAPIPAVEKPADESGSQKTGTPGPGGDVDGSQGSKASSVFSQPVGSDEATDPKSAPAPTTPSSTALDLMRLRLAFDFILTNYVPPHVSKELLLRLDRAAASSSSSDSIDFAPLRTHLAEIKRQRASLALLHQTSFSRKHDLDDEEREDAAAEKRRKKDEEEKKRKSESFGVKQLRKVDTSGMKKLSSFFTAKPKAK